jgi:hypothetical protein
LPLVQIIAFVLGGATAWYKCPLAGASRGLLQPTRYKCHTFVPVGGSDRYKCEDDTFVSGGDTPRYKRGNI